MLRTVYCVRTQFNAQPGKQAFRALRRAVGEEMEEEEQSGPIFDGGVRACVRWLQAALGGGGGGSSSLVYASWSFN